jgi:hypothetical protein
MQGNRVLKNRFVPHPQKRFERRSAFRGAANGAADVEWHRLIGRTVDDGHWHRECAQTVFETEVVARSSLAQLTSGTRITFVGPAQVTSASAQAPVARAIVESGTPIEKAVCWRPAGPLHEGRSCGAGWL